MNTLISWYNQCPSCVLGSIVAIIILIYIFLKRETLRFKFVCFCMQIPFIGTIARASRKTYHNQEWFAGEEEICRKFMPFYRYYDKDILLYAKSKDYLSKIDELDRTPIPGKWKILLGILVIAEAFTFSYLLAGYVVMDASEMTQIAAGFLVALILSIILLALTHAVGVQLYENHIKQRILGYSKKYLDADLIPDYSINLENTFKDKNEPNFKQMLNRFKANSSLKNGYLITVITIIIMLVISIGATTIRLETYNKHIIEETAIMQENVFIDNNLPQDVQQNQQKVDEKIIKKLESVSQTAGWVSFGILAFLFFGIQVWGIMLGYSYGFLGKESKKAYRLSGNFPSEFEFKRYYTYTKSHINQYAQKYLSKTQDKITKRVAKGKIFDPLKQSNEIVKLAHLRTFAEYVKKENNIIDKMDKERFHKGDTNA